MDEHTGTTALDGAARLHRAYASVTSAQRALLQSVLECDRAELWEADGCRDYAQWLSGRLGISQWLARRVINAAHTLPHLARISDAFAAGALSLDKVVELCRFATTETEAELVAWARRVLPVTIRERADAHNRRVLQDVVDADRSRHLQWWWTDDHTMLGLGGFLSADQGAVLTKALDRIAGRLPEVVLDDHERVPRDGSLEERRADALVALASAHIADDADGDRATVVVHAELGALSSSDRACSVEGGPFLHPETARRLACDCRLEVVLEATDGRALGIGRAARTPSAWLRRQLLYRDRACTFPGCGARRFLHAHHIVHWIRGGVTELDNLALVCSFHHRLVHEHGWGVELARSGTTTWYRPDGRRYQVGPSPPELVGMGHHQETW